MNQDSIAKIVKASGVQPGELVLVHFWGEDSEKATANAFVTAVASLGASPVLLQQARTVNHAIFQRAADACYGENYFAMFSQFDAVLDVFACQPIVLGYPLEPEQLQRYRNYIAGLFGALMKARRFAQIRIPTGANAVESGLEPEDYIRRMERAYDIDYDALLNACVKEKERLAQSKRLVLRSGSNHALSFDLSGREWHIDAGDGDWPCGEIYIAPNETRTNGTVYFERLFLEDVGELTHVTLEIREGKVMASDNEKVRAFVEKQPPENRVVCELGLGMNPNVTDLCGCTVLDEKMAGSFHIALGANHMFGGENRANMHMDLVGSGAFTLRSEELS